MICLDFVELGILYGVITMVKPSFFQRHVGCHKMPGKAAKSSAKPKKVGKQLSTLELWIKVVVFVYVVVSNIFYFHPYLGKIPILTNIFRMGWNHQLVVIWCHRDEMFTIHGLVVWVWNITITTGAVLVWKSTLNSTFIMNLAGMCSSIMEWWFHLLIFIAEMIHFEYYFSIGLNHQLDQSHR